MPGPNDYNVVMDGDTITLEPGLGKDEPSEQARLKMRDNGQAKMLRLKEELLAQGAALTERERAAVAREEAAIAKERELEARERALAAQEKAAGAKK